MSVIQDLRDAYAENPAKALDMLPKLFETVDERKIIELPCKVGDVVYALNYTTGKIINCCAVHIEIDVVPLIHVLYETDDVCEESECEGCPFNSWSQSLIDEDWSCGGESGEFVFNYDDFGKTVFLTHKAAEKALTEQMKGEKT